MTPTPTIDLRPRNVGELLDLTFHLYRRNFLRLIGITLVVMGPLLALNLLSSTGSLINYATMLSDTIGAQSNGPGPVSVITTAIAGCAGALAVLAGIFTPWMDGALVFNVIEQVLGRRPDWRASYSQTRSRWGALWIANAIRTVALVLCLIPLVAGLYGSLIAGLVGFSTLASSPSGSTDSSLLLAGLAAICLPIGLVGGGLAIYITANWCLTVPAIVGEGVDGGASLGRSSALVNNHRWRMIGRLLIFEVMRFFIITLPVMAVELFVLGGSIAAVGGGDTSPFGIAAIIGSSIFSALASVLVAPLYSVYITVNYLDLRTRKENLDLQLKVAQLSPSRVPAEVAASEPVDQGWPASTVETPAQPISPVPIAPASDKPALAAAPGRDFGVALTPAQRISVLYKQVRNDGENAELHNELGLAYQEVGDLYSALDSFIRARALAPGNPVYAYNLALLQRIRKELPSARKSIADYLQLETNPVERQHVLDNPALQDLLP
ncbi:MAG: hypothetical protein M1434_04100 [Chloroflexi bacterium]|nr:hypothetical protein [Chloroflexota bacterium]MCL5273914.1 hypothetical protein [Chloroflexota bacterium]